MAQGILIDTDILVDYLRGYSQAKTFLESLESRPSTSVICVAELFAGIRDEKEQAAIERFLLPFELLSVDDQIARLGGQFRKSYRHSHGTGLADAIIAATAYIHGYTLATFNDRHYPMVSNWLMPYSKSA